MLRRTRRGVHESPITSELRLVMIGAATLAGVDPSHAALRHPQEPPPQGESESEVPVETPPAAPPDQMIPRMERIIVTASRREESLLDSPFFADVRTAGDIADGQFRTLPEVLREVPGVMIQKTSHGQGSPYIRGFTSFRTLLLIDGIRLNNSVFREGPNQYWNTVDPWSIKRLEVVKGPSSVLYGSDAIGGTVNVITKGPANYADGFQFGGSTAYRFSTAERSHTVRGEVSGTWDQSFGLYVGGTGKHFGDLEAGSGRKPMTGYNEWDGDFKFEYFIDPDTRLVLAHQRVDLDDAWRTHSTIFAESFRGTTIGSDRRRVLDQNRELTYLQLHAEQIDSWIQTARFSVSFQSQEEVEDRVRSDGRRNLQGFDADTFGAWAQFESASPIGLWTYGLEYYRDFVDSFRRDYNADGSLNAIRIQGPVADDSTYDLAGVFVQNDIPVGDRLNAILGARANYAHADAGRVEDPVSGMVTSFDDEYTSVVGSARFVYRLDEEERWRLFGGASQGFRAPNLSDLSRLDFARSNEIETPSPGLDPEQFIAFEIGAKAEYEDLFAQIAFFHTDIEDMIIRQPTGQIIDGRQEVTKRNSGDGFVHGVEFGASWRFHPCWTAFGSVVWMEGEVDSFPTSAPIEVREPLSRVMPLTGQVGLRWQAPNRDFWIEGLVTAADEADRLSSSDLSDTQRIPPGGTPGYATLSLRSGWQVNHNLSVNFTVDNITNEDYRVHGSGVNEPGINFILGVKCTF